MVSQIELIDYLDALLQAHQYRDYCPNGLQIQGNLHIRTLVTGVTASQALIDAAIAHQADALLVHHGYFWKGESAPITGIKQTRIKSLLAHNINLIVYHLPLDTHPIYGNNAQLAQKLELTIDKTLDVETHANLIYLGHLSEPMSAEAFSKRLSARLKQPPLHIAGRQVEIKTLAWCTGAAQDYIEIAAQHGVDAYLTGEVSERTFHFAKEANIHFYAAGHHATERFGVEALGQHLAAHFGLTHYFIDIPNPI